MATDVIMPALGVAQEKGTLIQWLKAEGEPVKKGEPLMEVETDKATVEIEAPATGILSSVTALPGDEVPVGKTIALIVAAGEAVRSAPPPDRAAPEVAPIPPAPSAPAAVQTAAAPAGKIPASPAARRLARERRIDLTALRGTGPSGAILAADVPKSKEEPPAAAGPAAVKETVPLTPMRRIVGERMAKSKQTAPHFYLTMDADMTGVTRRREQLKQTGEGLVPSINDYILHAAAQALRRYPSLNAAFAGTAVELYGEINLGVAVAIEDGLVVPVIRNADRLSLGELAQKSRELADKAQRKKLFPLDYEGGTFTVSNLGMFGVDNFVAIINPPQCAILAVGRVAPRVVAHGEGIAVRSMMTMTLSADHRVADGAVAARFLQEVKEQLERAGT